MFCLSRTATTAVSPIPDAYRTYRGAGLVFTNGSLVLCGYEPNKHKPAIYGIGGKRESGDTTYRHTAFREATEEILGIRRIPERVWTKLLSREPHGLDMVGGYIMMYYTFADLEYFLKSMRGLSTPFYARMPRSLAELLLDRATSASTEMTHLCMVPVVSPTPSISRDLAGDIERIIVRRRL